MMAESFYDVNVCRPQLLAHAQSKNKHAKNHAQVELQEVADK